MTVEVRRFRRDDREQLASLVNAHIGAVVPGMSVSVSRLLGQLEREPDEFVVDPWVVERVTLVAVQRERIAAAVHLLRYGSSPQVGESYADAGEIRWFVFWPDAAAAGEVLLRAAIAQLDRWGTARQLADGSLPAPGVYGIPAQWPHVEAALRRARFEHGGGTEIVFLRDLGEPPERRRSIPGVSIARSLGGNGTRLAARLGDEEIGFVEVETLGNAERLARAGGWADIGDLFEVEQQRCPGVGELLIEKAAAWLRLAHVDRLLAYATPDQHRLLELYAANGFAELTRTKRGWSRAAS
jgi:GNAT superfamily N-acetyltransferase